MKNQQKNLLDSDLAISEESLILNKSEVSRDKNSLAKLQQCQKCKNYDEVFLTKPGSSKFEFSSWVVLFPLGPFYSIWRHLSPKKKLCRVCIPPPKKPATKFKKIVNLAIMIAILALLLAYKDELAETYRQIQLINESLKELKK